MADMQEPEMIVSSLSGKQPRVHMFTQSTQSKFSMPPTRYLLFVGSLIAIALPFVPWFSTTIPIGVGGGILLQTTYNPIVSYTSYIIRFLTHASHLSTIFEVVLTLSTSGIVLPGIIGSIWVHAQIRTMGQRTGVVIFSLWVLFLTGFGFYATAWMNANYNPVISFRGVFTDSQLTPTTGWYIFLLTIALLWLGLISVWIEIYRSRQVALLPTVHRQSSGNYLGATFITVGLVIWFIGYYGIYWVLPTNCPFTPLFGSAQCNNRLSAGTGFGRFMTDTATTLHIGYPDLSLSSLMYWGLGVIIVSVGFAFALSGWLRSSSTIELYGAVAWILLIVGLTWASYSGCRQLGAIYAGENWTAGLPVTLLGIALIGLGWIFRQRNNVTVSVPQIEASPQ